MNKIKFILLIVVGLILLVGCEEGASIKIINETNYNVYAEIDGDNYTVSGDSSTKINVDTKEKVFLFDDGVTKKTLKIEGETFRIWDDYEGLPLEETEVKVTPGKTYNIYCSANSASVKVVNNSTRDISKLSYRMRTQFSSSELFSITFDPPLTTGEFAYEHIIPQTEENRFYYNFEVESDGELIYSIGDQFQGVELFMGQQHLIEIGGR